MKEGQGLCPWTPPRGAAPWIPAKGEPLEPIHWVWGGCEGSGQASRSVATDLEAWPDPALPPHTQWMGSKGSPLAGIQGAEPLGGVQGQSPWPSFIQVVALRRSMFGSRAASRPMSGRNEQMW